MRGAYHGGPMRDVGGVLLDLGGARTDCPPASAQPLVSWLERLAVATPEKVMDRTVHVTACGALPRQRKDVENRPTASTMGCTPDEEG